MSWRRRFYRGGERPERPFARRLKYETIKEGGGTLLQQVGAGLGAVIGLLTARWGIPPTASVVAGAVIGSTVGAIGKGFVTTAADHLKEQSEREDGAQSPAAQRGQLMATAVASPLGSVFDVTADVSKVIKRMTDAYAELGRLATELRSSHDALMLSLYGGRADALAQISARLGSTRRKLEEAQKLLMFAGSDLRAYLTSL